MDGSLEDTWWIIDFWKQSKCIQVLGEYENRCTYLSYSKSNFVVLYLFPWDVLLIKNLRCRKMRKRGPAILAAARGHSLWAEQTLISASDVSLVGTTLEMDPSDQRTTVNFGLRNSRRKLLCYTVSSLVVVIIEAERRRLDGMISSLIWR